MQIDQLITLCVQNVELLEYLLSKLQESEKGILLDGVGMKLVERFERMGSVDDIDRAITMEEKAIERQIGCLVSIGTGLMQPISGATRTKEQIGPLITLKARLLEV